MTPRNYRLPDGSVPILLSADTADLVNVEAARLLAYTGRHPEVSPQPLADMIFRTRIARRHRALAMVTDRTGLIGALQAVAAGREHARVVRADASATSGRLGYVFPGQGGQRPGMGRLFYESVPAFRAEVDRCATAFDDQFGETPLAYLLEDQFAGDDGARTVQPALFAYMAGLAALWRSFGVTPHATIGHSQGELAAAYVSGAMTLTDAALVVGIRARAADGCTSGDYAMAVVATDRDRCEDVLARYPGWAQVSVVNSPGMIGVSGDRQTVHRLVDIFAERGVFARVIRVRYPAHTSAMNQLADTVRANTHGRLMHSTFLVPDVDCLGATFGGPLPRDLPVTDYWLLNLRNTVRFDKAIAAAIPLGIDTFVELADHPMLQSAIHENLAAQAGERTPVVVGTSARTATDLAEFTRNLAVVATHHPDYSWATLATDSDGPGPLPLLDFPNTAMADVRLWLPYDDFLAQRMGPGVQPAVARAAVEPSRPVTQTPARLLEETWVRLAQRSLVPPRAIGILDHTGAYRDVTTAWCAAATDIGATAQVIDAGQPVDGLDAYLILVPPSRESDCAAVVSEVDEFFAERSWWPVRRDGVTDCWLVTVAGERVAAGDAPPDRFSAAVSAGFRSIGAEYPGIRFGHLDIPCDHRAQPGTALALVTALHTRDESELALRDGGLYAKRVVERDAAAADPVGSAADHVLVVGGTGTVGLEFCAHFARHGARLITLVSRSGGTAAITDRLRQIAAATGADIRVEKCDIGDIDAVSRLAAEHQGSPAEVIVHAAVEYSGSQLSDIEAGMVERATRAKVVGIDRILATYPRTDDCRVVLCSSVAANVGGRGLIVYAAANRMLDAMAHQLRAQGLSCVSVQWGHWAVTFDPDDQYTAKLAVTGLQSMSAGDALALGMSPLSGNAIVAAFDVGRARSVLESCGRASLLAQLSEPAAPAHAAAPGVAEPHADLSRRVMELLAGTIGMDGAETIDTTVPMVAIGLDSLQALEFRRRMKAEFDYDVEVSELLGGASVGDVLCALAAQSV